MFKSGVTDKVNRSRTNPTNTLQQFVTSKKRRINNHPMFNAEKDLIQQNNNDSKNVTNNSEDKKGPGRSICQKCHKGLSEFELSGLSDCEHKFCGDCVQESDDSKHFICPVCKIEYYWFFQVSTGNKFFVGSFDPIRAAIVETVNQSKDLIIEFQTKIITNFSTVKNHNTEMLTRLYVSLKHLQSTMIWDDIQAFKIELTDGESRVMIDMYAALTQLSQCQFADSTGLEKPNIIDDMADNIPYLIWLRNHLLKLEKYLDPSVLSRDMFERILEECVNNRDDVKG